MLYIFYDNTSVTPMDMHSVIIYDLLKQFDEFETTLTSLQIVSNHEKTALYLSHAICLQTNECNCLLTRWRHFLAV